jgi:uncharacterized membrane protein YphA (DoxX/SURF4 family)
MKKATLIVRILLGLIVLIFGINKFLQFMPTPPMPDAAGEFMGALVASGYLMVVVALVEVATGIMLLTNRFQPLALVLLFPVLINAFLFHLFLAPAGIGGALVATGMNVFLFFAHIDSYRALLQPKQG